MVHMKKRRLLCVSLLVLNLCFIWGNSLLPAEYSEKFSRFVGRIVSFFFGGNVDVSAGTGHGILRKMAHFSEFCSLGIVLCWLFRMLRSRRWEHCLLPFVCGVAAAGVDETIQIFVPGRGPAVRDVCIDSAGVALGVAISLLVVFLQKRKRPSCRAGAGQ